MTRTRSASVAAALVALAGCASLPQGEYRDDRYEHREPTYSFRMPTAWRPLTEADVDGLGYFGQKFTQDAARPSGHERSR
jgi:hypothetical protein